MKIFKFLFLAILPFTNCKKDGNVPISKASGLDSDETTIYLRLDVDSKGNGIGVEYGACCSTNHIPTVIDKLAKVETITYPFINKYGLIEYKFSYYRCIFDSLTPNTTYYIRSWANNLGAIYYGEEINFKTLKGIALLTTKDVTSISAFTAICGGNITHDGGLEVTARGVCWKRYPGGMGYDPTIEDSHSNDGNGIGSFTSTTTNLLCNDVTYKVRAYATNSAGTAYGNVVVFSTAKGIPILSTSTAITSDSSVTCGGIISDQGGAPVTACGICISKTVVLTTLENCDLFTNEGSSSGEFTSTINGLSYRVIYNVRAYAKNSFGVAYGNNTMFILLPPFGQ